MASYPGSKELGDAIKARRESLNMSVFSASMRAEVREETWNGYESGSSIRTDKAIGVCRALGWSDLDPAKRVVADADEFSLNTLPIDKDSIYWSELISNTFGHRVAMVFYFGSSTLKDALAYTLERLSDMPGGSHIGQCGYPLPWELPPQFLTHYDYDFFYKLNMRLRTICWALHNQESFAIHMVADELLLHLCVESFKDLLDVEKDFSAFTADVPLWEEALSILIEDLFEDLDYLVLYEPVYLLPSDPYHFDNWFVHQFNTESIDRWDR